MAERTGEMNMAHKSAKGGIVQLLLDAALGLALFAVMVSLGTGGSDAHAEHRLAPDAAAYMAAAPASDTARSIVGLVSQASPQALTLSAPRPQAFYKNESVVLSVLAFVFSALFAMNMAFWRHLKAAYAPAS